MRATSATQLRHIQRWGLVGVSIGALVLLLTAQSALGVAGDLDPTFAGTGMTTTDIGRYDFAADVAIQADGKIVAVGATPVGPRDAYYWDFALVRYDTDGSLDPSFGGGDGKVKTGFGHRDASAQGVAIQPDGKLVVTGEGGLYLARYRSDGSLDPTFGGDGRVRTELQSPASGYDIALQPNGKIVVAGIVESDGDAPQDVLLLRYERDGDLDPTFGRGGVVRLDFGGQDWGKGVAIEAATASADARIVVVGSSVDFAASPFEESLVMARYRLSGSLDTTFSGNGRIKMKIKTPWPEDATRALDVAIQPNGKILVAGGASGKMALLRYLDEGILDPTFSGDGWVRADFGGASAEAAELAIQDDGTIVAAGGTFSSDFHSDFALARFRRDGRLDPTFSGDGKVITDFGHDDDASGVAIQADGKIVAAGKTGRQSGTPDFAVARYKSG
jgi:uncharacterized delta-60 repeat protein